MKLNRPVGLSACTVITSLIAEVPAMLVVASPGCIQRRPMKRGGQQVVSGEVLHKS